MMPSLAHLCLVSISGPSPVRMEMGDRDEVSIGRLDHHDLVLEHPEVSRNHARLTISAASSDPRWRILDLESRHGTRLNGIRLEPGRPYPLQAGDLIDIDPWTLRLQDTTGPAPSEMRLHTRDDATMVSGLAPITRTADALAREQLRLLLECAESIQQVTDESALARAVIEAAVSGTGFANAAVLRPLGPDGTVDLVAARGDITRGDELRLSRSLIRKASEGLPVGLGSMAFPAEEAVSIVSLNIEEALCVPLMLGTTVAGFLYLDRRGQHGPGSVGAAEAEAFAVGLGRLAALTLADLKRQELAVRHARVEGELAAAATAQQWVLPRREGRIGSVAWTGECRPGRGVSGDFFDLMALDGGRVAVTLGDVSGKGVPASVLMTVAQGFLNAGLRRGGDPSGTVSDLNEFLCERSEVGKFLTLWVGVIDGRAGSLTYVNAGHGYAMMRDPSGSFTALDTLSGPVIGVEARADYDSVTVPLAEGARVILVSDGIIEQLRRQADGRHEQFGRDRVRECIAALPPGSDEVQSIYDAVRAWGSGDDLSDDATVVVVRLTAPE